MYILGIRQYFLKDDPSTLPRARRIFKFLYFADCLLKIVLAVFVAWIMYTWIISAKLIIATLVETNDWIYKIWNLLMSNIVIKNIYVPYENQNKIIEIIVDINIYKGFWNKRFYLYAKRKFYLIKSILIFTQWREHYAICISETKIYIYINYVFYLRRDMLLWHLKIVTHFCIYILYLLFYFRICVSVMKCVSILNHNCKQL